MASTGEIGLLSSASVPEKSAEKTMPKNTIIRANRKVNFKFIGEIL
jgi:hypothetical protein